MNIFQYASQQQRDVDDKVSVTLIVANTWRQCSSCNVLCWEFVISRL